MTPQETAIAAIVSDVCSGVKPDDTSLDTPLTDLGVDSLDVASIFLAIHEQLGVRVPDADIDGLDTVRRIAGYVAARRG